MSIDYALWRWKEVPPPITAGLCYLLLAAGLECPEAAPLDVERLQDELERAFPDWTDLPLVVNFGPSVLLLDTYGSTPTSLLEWFVDLAAREGMVFFDPQNEPITEADEKELQRRAEESQRRSDALRAEASLAEWRAKVSAGDPEALFRLGNCYSFGEGVAKDLEMAFSLFERSARAGYSDGMFNLAACYRLGEGVAKDVQKAISWYERAAETDPRFAYYALGEIYANGETGSVDKEKAIHSLQLAWDHGNTSAYTLLRSLGVRPRSEDDSSGSGPRRLPTSLVSEPSSPPVAEPAEASWLPWSSAVALWAIAISVVVGLASASWGELVLRSVMGAVAINAYLLMRYVVPDLRRFGRSDRTGAVMSKRLAAGLLVFMTVLVFAGLTKLLVGIFI